MMTDPVFLSLLTLTDSQRAHAWFVREWNRYWSAPISRRRHWSDPCRTMAQWLRDFRRPRRAMSTTYYTAPTVARTQTSGPMAG